MINPFVPNAPFLYHLKTSENRKVVRFSDVFRGQRKDVLATKGLSNKTLSQMVCQKSEGKFVFNIFVNIFSIFVIFVFEQTRIWSPVKHL